MTQIKQGHYLAWPIVSLVTHALIAAAWWSNTDDLKIPITVCGSLLALMGIIKMGADYYDRDDRKSATLTGFVVLSAIAVAVGPWVPLGWNVGIWALFMTLQTGVWYYVSVENMNTAMWGFVTAYVLIVSGGMLSAIHKDAEASAIGVIVSSIVVLLLYYAASYRCDCERIPWGEVLMPLCLTLIPVIAALTALFTNHVDPLIICSLVVHALFWIGAGLYVMENS